MKSIVLIVLSLIALASANISMDTAIQATLKLNTIHDGYYSTLSGPIWIFQDKFLVISACNSEFTASVIQQFLQAAVIKLTGQNYVIPFTYLNPEVNLNESETTIDLIFSVKRELSIGLALSLTVSKKNSGRNMSVWADQIVETVSSFEELTQLSREEIDPILHALEKLNIANLCGKVDL